MKKIFILSISLGVAVFMSACSSKAKQNPTPQVSGVCGGTATQTAGGTVVQGQGQVVSNVPLPTNALGIPAGVPQALCSPQAIAQFMQDAKLKEQQAQLACQGVAANIFAQAMQYGPSYQVQQNSIPNNCSNSIMQFYTTLTTAFNGQYANTANFQQYSQSALARILGSGFPGGFSLSPSQYPMAMALGQQVMNFPAFSSISGGLSPVLSGMTGPGTGLSPVLPTGSGQVSPVYPVNVTSSGLPVNMYGLRAPAAASNQVVDLRNGF